MAISRSQAFVSQQLESIVDHTSQAVDMQLSQQGLQMPSHTDMQLRLRAMAPLLDVMLTLNPESLATVRIKYASLMHTLLNKVGICCHVCVVWGVHELSIVNVCAFCRVGPFKDASGRF